MWKATGSTTAHTGVSMIDLMYEVEELGRGLPLDERHDRRQVVRVGVNGFFNWAEDTMRRISAKGALADAIRYAVKRREARRRLAPNRLGYVVQLCYLRHPGRRLLPGEAVPAAILSLPANQIGCQTDDFADYSTCATTLREHRLGIEAYLGLRAFNRVDVRSVLMLRSEIAISTDRGEDRRADTMSLCRSTPEVELGMG